MKKVVSIRALLLFVFSVFLFFLVGSEVNAANDESWGYSYLHLDEFAKKISNTEKEVVVAVLDTGIDTNHEWFKGRIKSGGMNCLNQSRKCKAGGYEDDHFHGTFVSGIIAKTTPNNVKILPIKVLNYENKGYVVDFVAAINEVIKLKKQGMNIVAINFSITSKGQPLNSYYNNLYKEAFQAAYDAGILSVAAAGNDKNVVTNVSPANLENVIVVSSLTKTYSGIVAFSNTFSNYGNTIDFSAPGDDIVSARNGGGITSGYGTSYSVPHVVASIAMLYSMCQNCTPQAIEKVMLNSTNDLGSIGKDKYFGNGVIDMNKAYTNILKEIKHVVSVKTSGSNKSYYSMSRGIVPHAGETKINFIPEKYYEVTKIVVNGKALSYTEVKNATLNGLKLTNIQENILVEVVFSKVAFQVNITMKRDKTVTAIQNCVTSGNNFKYAFSIPKNYKIKKIIIDNKSLTGAAYKNAAKNGYTFSKVDKNHTIVVEYEKQSFLEKLFNIKW